MDVITFLQPENHVSNSHSRFQFRFGGHKKADSNSGNSGGRQDGLPSRSLILDGQYAERSGADAIGSRLNQATRGERFAQFFPQVSFSALREMPAVSGFPIVFIIILAFCMAMTPVLQNTIGFYRLDRMSFPDEPSAETGMRLLVSPDPDASQLSDSSDTDLPLSIRAVTWSTCKVRRGENIGAIVSRAGLKNISTVLSVNNIDNVRHIKVGQTLKLPSTDGILYTVARGDSISRVAKRYSVPITLILDANDLANSTLAAGQQLFIPGATLSVMELRRAMGALFAMPLAGRLTSSFGYRADPFTGVRTFHTGIDLAAPTGTPIKAVLDGKVAITGFSAVFGNYVIVTHDGGFQTLYGHMSYIGVERGQSVAQGTVIGKVGTTGYSTGPHLHLSVYKNGKMIDPLSVLK